MNKVIASGNLTRDPELKTTQSGKSVCTLTIAVNRRFDREKSDFFNVVTWNKLADNCAKYLAKGRKIAVVGELQTRTYDANDGTKRYVTEIIADEIEFLNSQSGERHAPSARNESAAKSTNDDVFSDMGDDEIILGKDEELPF